MKTEVLSRAYLSNESSQCSKAMSQVSGALIAAKRIYQDLQNSTQKIVSALCRKACLHMEEENNSNCMRIIVRLWKWLSTTSTEDKVVDFPLIHSSVMPYSRRGLWHHCKAGSNFVFGFILPLFFFFPHSRLYRFTEDI